MRSIAVGVTCGFGKYQTEKEEEQNFSLFSLPRKAVGLFFFFLGGGKGGMCLRSNFTDVCMKENADY